MNKVSIRTAQNIAIDFPVASLSHRILAFVIDIAILGVSTGVLALILSIISSSLNYGLIAIFVLYTPVSEMLMNGQTLGKKAMRTRVVNVNGKEPTMLDFLIRWAFRLVDIWFSIGSLAVIFISTSPRSQRLGGLLSNTMVVSLGSEMDLGLKDILRIEDRSKYEPEFLEAYRFSEDEMLTVKSVLDRYEKYHNTAHSKLVQAAAKRCADVLGLPNTPENKPVFLKTVLRDYIVITRS